MRQLKKYCPLRSLVVHKTWNLIISRRFLGEDDKEMHQNAKTHVNMQICDVFVLVVVVVV